MGLCGRSSKVVEELYIHVERVGNEVDRMSLSMLGTELRFSIG